MMATNSCFESASGVELRLRLRLLGFSKVGGEVVEDEGTVTAASAPLDST